MGPRMATIAERIGDASLAGGVRWQMLLHRVSTWKDREDGAVAAEYALILGLVAVAIFLAVAAFGATLLGLFERANDRLP